VSSCPLHPDGSPTRPEWDDTQCVTCFRLAGGVTPKAGRVPRTPPARGPCLHLGRRVEFRPGCGGRNCRHECAAGEPVAVPGGVCQTCPKYEPEGT
jgi:hypothetical protein